MGDLIDVAANFICEPMTLIWQGRDNFNEA